MNSEIDLCLDFLEYLCIRTTLYESELGWILNNWLSCLFVQPMCSKHNYLMFHLYPSMKVKSSSLNAKFGNQSFWHAADTEQACYPLVKLTTYSRCHKRLTQHWLQLVFNCHLIKGSGCVFRKGKRQSSRVKSSPPPSSYISITQPSHFPSDYTASTVVIKNVISTDLN